MCKKENSYELSRVRCRRRRRDVARLAIALVPTFIACSIGSAQMARQIEDQNALVSYEESANAPEAPDLGIAVALAENTDTGDQLIDAAFDGNVQKVSLLLDGGADPAFVDARGFSALSAASFHGAYAVAELLLKAGADVDFAPGERSLTPLMWALLPVISEPSVTTKGGQQQRESLNEQKVRVALLLVRHGADLTSRNADGETALMLACGYRTSGLRTLLHEMLARGADPKSINKYGRTALMYAAFSGAHAAMAELLEHGADPRRTDLAGRSALSIASEQQDDVALNLLCKHVREGAASFTGQHCANRQTEKVEETMKNDRNRSRGAVPAPRP